MRTIDLLDRAVSKAKSERSLALELGLAPTALSTARSRGKLSTAIAVVLAQREGEDVTQWAIQAVEENEKSDPLRRKLAAIRSALKS